jgi:TonB family protein
VALEEVEKQRRLAEQRENDAELRDPEIQKVLNRGETSGAISGRVYEQSTSNPVSEALVTVVSKSGRRTTKTRPDGSYQFSFLPKGEYTLTVEHENYANASIVKSVSEGEITVAEGIYLISTAASRPRATIQIPKIIRKSSGIAMSEAIRRTAPEYPEEAKQARISGSVVVEVTIDEEGNVISTRTISGHPLFRKPAEEAARQWKFRPTLLSGQPVKVITTLTFSFTD